MTEPGRPILAVDVDGVLNALGGGRVPRGWQETRVLGFRIRFNPSHGAALLAVAEAAGAELTWCTTWEERANEYIRHLAGLPELPVVPIDPGVAEVSRAPSKFGSSPSVGAAKAAALRQYAGDRPFCWLDDERDAARALASCLVPHLVIRVEPRAGLADRHLRRAAAWLAVTRAP